MSAADKSRVASALAAPLHMPAQAIDRLLTHPPGPEYVLLRKAASQATAQHVNGLQLPGITISSQPSYKRLYPNGSLAANLVGFTNPTSDGGLVGEAGLEQEFNSLLAGRDGSERVEQSLNHVPIAGTESDLKPPVPARNLRLTVQSSIQFAAQAACAYEVLLTRARNCSIVVMDPHTGAVLAMAQYPTFNPGKPVTSLAATHNIATFNTFAPGSTLKPLTVAAAMERAARTR